MHQQFRYGFGRKVVMLHGLGSSGRYWGEPAKLLFNKYQIISFDLLGFGESPCPSPYGYYLWQQADALRQAMWAEHLWGRVSIVGHSLGALVALEFAKRYPKKIDKLILSNMPLIINRRQANTTRDRYSDLSREIQNALHRKGLKVVRKSKFIQEKLTEKYAQYKKNEGVFSDYDLQHISRYAYLQSIKHGLESFDCLSNLDRVDARTFVVVASKDRVIIKGNVAKLVHGLPNAELVETDGTHQLPILRAKEFADIVKNCLG